MKRILLNREDFETLVSGKIVKQDDTEIALSDIGYSHMISIIENSKL